jgi:hypothetical protein
LSFFTITKSGSAWTFHFVLKACNACMQDTHVNCMLISRCHQPCTRCESNTQDSLNWTTARLANSHKKYSPTSKQSLITILEPKENIYHQLYIYTIYILPWTCRCRRRAYRSRHGFWTRGRSCPPESASWTRTSWCSSPTL